MSYWNPCFWLVISRFVTDFCHLSLEKKACETGPGCFVVFVCLFVSKEDVWFRLMKRWICFHSGDTFWCNNVFWPYISQFYVNSLFPHDLWCHQHCESIIYYLCCVWIVLFFFLDLCPQTHASHTFSSPPPPLSLSLSLFSFFTSSLVEGCYMMDNDVKQILYLQCISNSCYPD